MYKKMFVAVFSLFIISRSISQSPQLWGLAYAGGTGNFGTIMKINGDGTDFSVYNLRASTGFAPAGSLVLEKNNLFYGMTFSGGAHGSGVLFGFNSQDTVYSDLFDIAKIGNYNVLSDLVAGPDSLIYGILYEGGPLFKGALFSLDYVTHACDLIYQVTDTTQGANPRSMIWAANNKLYGITDSGGLYNLGTIFSFDPATNIFTDLHDFDSINYAPCGGLVQATNGLLYGLTSEGGAGTLGTVYSFDTATGTFTDLHDFKLEEGAPYWNNALVKAGNNILYGMAENGGNNNWGTIFSFDPGSNTFEKLYAFDSVNGKWSAGRLMQASDGKMYGMATYGGSENDGTIFSFDYTNNVCTKLKDLSPSTGINPIGYLAEYTGPLAIQQPKNEFTISIYPNPAMSELNFQLPEIPGNAVGSTLFISNALGQVIGTQIISQAVSHLDISTYSPGLYHIHLLNNGNTWQGKFVKE